MNHRGHPKKPHSRRKLPLQTLVDSFLRATREEDPGLTRYLDELDADGRRELGGVLGRFDTKARGELSPEQRLLARRVLTRVHRPTGTSLERVNRILDYLDLDSSALLEEKELEFSVEILEMFARAESDNATLSENELAMMYAVLRHLDANHNQRLDPWEKERLHEALKNPDEFLEQQLKDNPLLQELLKG